MPTIAILILAFLKAPYLRNNFFNKKSIKFPEKMVPIDDTLFSSVLSIGTILPAALVINFNISTLYKVVLKLPFLDNYPYHELL